MRIRRWQGGYDNVYGAERAACGNVGHGAVETVWQS